MPGEGRPSRRVFHRSTRFSCVFYFLGSEALNYLLCCIHLDARFSAGLIHAGLAASQRKLLKRQEFNRKSLRGNLGGCNLGGPPRRFHPRCWMSLDENVRIVSALAVIDRAASPEKCDTQVGKAEIRASKSETRKGSKKPSPRPLSRVRARGATMRLALIPHSQPPAPTPSPPFPCPAQATATRRCKT